MNDITQAAHCGNNSRRSLRHWRQCEHLRQCGTRCILEALLAVESSESLDAVLADFERLPPQTYHATLYHYAAMAE
jgi:hypothetical protein